MSTQTTERRTTRSRTIDGRTPLGSIRRLGDVGPEATDPLHHLEKRDTDLWLLASLVVVLLALGLACLHLGLGRGAGFAARSGTAVPLVVGLLSLVAILLSYVSRRRHEISGLRRTLIREQTEKNELSARLGELRLLLNVAQELQVTLGFDGLVRRCVEIVAHLVDADRALVLIADRKGRLDLAAWLAEDGNLGSQPVTCFQTLMGIDTLAGGEALICSEAGAVTTIFGKSAWTRNVSATIVCPLRAGSRVFGFLVAQQLEEEHAHRFGDYHRKLMTILGGFASHVLTVARAQKHLKQSNQRLKSSMRKLERAQAQLVQVEKLTALGDLVSGVAHELNNPLTAVTGYAQVLLSLPDDKLRASRSYLESIQTEAMRCSVIVGNLLAFARGPGHGASYEPVLKVVEDILSLKAYDFRRFQIETQVDIPPDLPVPAIDRGKLQLVVLNLVNNAIFAMRDRPVRRLDIVARKDAGRVVLSVKDTGTGIPGHIQGHIFEPFFSTKRKGDGIGLGLSTCVSILEGYEGSLAVESREGSGSTFTLHLPTAPAAVCA